jgi:hypothetical protein
MINSCLKIIPVLMFITILSYGEECLNEQYIFEAGLSTHLLKNKLAGKIKIPSFGLHCTFPVGIANTSIQFSAEYGKIIETKKVKSTEIILSEIALRYTFTFYRDLFFLTPSISLENCALHLQPSGKLDDFVIIATWENEFGAGVGCEPGFLWKICTISLPVNVSTIFTGEPAYIFSCGIRVGVVLRKKRDGAR